MDWLSAIGDFFNAVTNPIDALMGFIVQLGVEMLSWTLGQLVSVMKLTDTFTKVKFTMDLFSLVNSICLMLTGAVATYYVFTVVLDIATGGEGESPMKVIGKFLHYGLRLVSMPFFLFTALKLNSAFVSAMQTFGLSSDKIVKNLQLSNSDSSAFLKRLGTLFDLPDKAILIGALFALGMAIIVVVLLFQLITRTGEVFFLYVLIPPVCITVFTKDLDMYSSWWRQVISVIGGQAVQLIGLYAGIQFLLEGYGIVGIGVLIATAKTPAVIKEFAYNSGGGGIVRQAISTGSLMIVR